MALTLPLPGVPDSRQYLGAGAIQESFLIIPGTSDYPTSGYVLTPAMCRLMRGFQQAWISGCNAAVITGAWEMIPVMTLSLTSNSLAQLQTQLNLYVCNGSMVQVSANTNLTGAAWVLTVIGN